MEQKVFFDIGTNNFQGYNELSSMLKINEDWHKVFVEPNPNFWNNQTWLDYLNSIKNSHLYRGALCGDCNQKTSELMFIEGFNDLDQGASIYNDVWISNNRVTKTINVETFCFDKISENYKDFEWFIKMDCENCEYFCLKNIILNHHKNIKFIICEFHYPVPTGYENYLEEIISLCNLHKIEFHLWK